MVRYSKQGFDNTYDESSFWQSLNSAMSFHLKRNTITNSSSELRSLRHCLAKESDLLSRRGRVSHIDATRQKHLSPTFQPELCERPNNLNGGKLMAYFPDQNMCDGVAEDVSDGFFDVDNMPPHDLWISMIEGAPDDRLIGDFLIAWVPPEYITSANDGMEVNPEECVIWLENHKHPLVNALRAFGLLTK